MKLIFRLITVAFVFLVVFAIAGIIATWAPDRTVQQLSLRWAQAPSMFLDVDGMQVHLRDEGPKDDPVPIVLLHGTSASLHTWEGWTKELARSRRIIRFDLPAFGLTGPHPQDDYSIGAYVSFVKKVVDTLGVKHFVIAGNSLGGQIAWETALAFPDRVDRLVLVDAAGYAFLPKSVPIGFQIARVPGIRLLMEHILPRGIIQSSLRNVYGDPGKVSTELVDRYYDLTLREGNRGAVAKRFESIKVVNEERVQALKLPTLILWGAKDNLIPVENGARFAKDIAGSKLVVFPELGHVPQEEDPVSTVRVVQEFLGIE